METPLQMRKRLLIAESEINRALLSRDFHAMTADLRDASKHLKNLGTLASVGAAVTLFVRSLTHRRPEKASPQPIWLSAGLGLLRLAMPLWIGLRGKKMPSNSHDTMTN